MADKMTIESVRREMKRDKRVAKLTKAFDEVPVFNLDFKELMEEVQMIHTVRKSRTLNRQSDTFVQDVIDSMLDDMSNRSRLSEVLMMCIKTERKLNDSLDSLNGYLQMEYSDSLRRVVKTKAERSQFLQTNILNRFYQYVNRVEVLKESLSIVMNDIDKGGYLYTNLIAAIKMASGNRTAI